MQQQVVLVVLVTLVVVVLALMRHLQQLPLPFLWHHLINGHRKGRWRVHPAYDV